MRLSFALAAFLVATPAFADKRQFANLVYDLPRNWDLGTVRDGFQVLIFDGDEDVCEFCYVYLSTGTENHDRLDRFLRNQSRRFVDEDDAPQIEILMGPEPIEDWDYPAAILGQTVDGRNLQILLAIDLGDRAELVAYQAPGDDQEEFARSVALFQDEVLTMLDGMRYVSEGARSALPDARPGDLDGAYWGWYQGTGFGLDGMMRIEVRQRLIVFWPDGHFYDGFPPSGLQPLDRDALMAAGDTSFGTYRERANRLDLTFANGVKERLRADGDGWTDDNRTLAEVELLADGTALEGTISSFFYTGFAPGSGVSGGASSSSRTTYKSDFTYEGARHGGVFGRFENAAGDATGGFAGGSDTAQGGRYEVRDGLVIHYPADGGAPSAVIAFRTGDDIVLGDQFLETD